MKKKLLIPLIALVLLGAAAGWYLRPRSFDAILPGFDRAEASYCSAYLFPLDQPVREVTLNGPSAEYDQLMDLLCSGSYRRALGDLLRLGRAADTQVISLDPYVHLSLYQDPEHRWSLALYGQQMVLTQIPSGTSRTFIPFRGSTFQREVADFLSDCLNQAES